MENRDYIKVLIIIFVLFTGCYKYLPKEKVFEEQTDVSENVGRFLSNLTNYYERKEISRFLSFISPDFYRDKQLFEDYIRDKLSQMDKIHLQIIIDKILRRNDKIFVKINWHKSYLQKNRLIKENGKATLILYKENKKLSVLQIEDLSPF